MSPISTKSTSKPDRVATAAASRREPLSLRIQGMTCGGCIARVERALLGVTGVTAARVNLTTETATIDVAEPRPKIEKLVEAVRRAGYDAEIARAGAAASSGLERTQEARLREQRRTLVQAFALALPILALQWLAPTLRSGERGGYLWPAAIQALLCLMLLGSSAGAPILVGGLRAIIHRSPNMDLLIALGVSVAFVSGTVGLLDAAGEPANFLVVAMILTFINVGRYLEMRAKREASSAVSSLMRRMPALAQLVTDAGLEEVPVERIVPGDRVRVAQDMVVPVDGTILDGEAAVDTSAVTGESMPRQCRVGDTLSAGTLVRDGLVTIEATRVGAESTMGRIIRAVEEAQSGKTKLQRIADRVAGVFVPVVILLALATLLGTRIPEGLDWSTSIRRAVAVLVIACPCAMGLATPTAVLVATGAAALRGILVRDAAVLEAAGQIRALLLDKTGTLTLGEPTVCDVLVVDPRPGHDSTASVPDATRLPSDPPSRRTPIPNAQDGISPQDELGSVQSHVAWGQTDGRVTTDGLSPDAIRILQLAASAEQYSQHPLARAIVASARDRGLVLDDPESFRNEAGHGVVASLRGQTIRVGSAALLREGGIDVTAMEAWMHESRPRAQQPRRKPPNREGSKPHTEAKTPTAADAPDQTASLFQDPSPNRSGKSTVLVAADDRCVGWITIADRVRPEAAGMIQSLRRMGIAPAMLTGDHAATAESVAADLGIEDVRAELTPEDKLAEVRHRRRGGTCVAFVGDGINDAPALAEADVGITLASATDVAAGAADITILHDDLRRLVDVISLARRSVTIIKQNLFWAFFYNVVAIPLAATGRIPPGYAAAAMMVSSLSVVMNSLRLRRRFTSQARTT